MSLITIGQNIALASSNDLVYKLDKVVDEFTDQHRFMGSVLIIENGKALYRKTSGVKNQSTQHVIEPTTPFKIASLTKQFTAAAILLLEQSGKLSLSNNINQYLEKPIEHWSNITIEHLLHHSSGIPNYTSLKSYQSFKNHRVSQLKMLELMAYPPLNHSPGSKNEYSNSGYFLLGMIIEKVSNLSYQEFIHKHVFTPLNMQHSGFIDDININQEKADGHLASENTLVLAQEVDMSSVFSAGNILSTTDDLAKWTSALFQLQLLSKASFEKMTLPTNPPGAYGIFHTRSFEHLKHHHSGGIEGFTSEWRYFSERKLAIIVLGNVQSPSVQSLTYQLERAVFESPYSNKNSNKSLNENSNKESNLVEAPKTLPLEQFTGTYQMEKQGINSHFFIKENQLFVLSPGKAPLALERIDKQAFHSELLSLNVYFSQDNHGKSAVSFEFLAQSNKVSGERISLEDNDTRLAAFTGVYKVRKGFYIAVFSTAQGFFAQATGQPAVPLHASSPYQFDTSIAGLSVKFSNSKPAEYLILKQGGNRAKAIRM